MHRLAVSYDIGCSPASTAMYWCSTLEIEDPSVSAHGVIPHAGVPCACACL